MRLPSFTNSTTVSDDRLTSPDVAPDDWRTAAQKRIEAVLNQIIPSAETYPNILHQAMRYAVLGGGKRIRPLLVYAAGALSRAPVLSLDYCAAAVELMHGYSLVHDDLPCMDDDVLRRGQPTCHVIYGEAMALLAGDALQTLAFKALSDLGTLVSTTSNPSPAIATLFQELSIASGSQGMCGGQAIDLASVGQPLTLDQLEQMHRHKTGALLRAAIRLGVYCGQDSTFWDAHTWQTLDRFAQAVGLAFQVTDDCLDATGNAASLGKTAGKDAQHQKPTYVTMLGLDAAQQHANTLYQEAMDALETLAGLYDLSNRTQRLRELTAYILQRHY